MRLNLDTQSPVPLYHQIAEAIAYQIATGTLKPGARLHAVRAAAEQWNVHHHTVRRAYRQLAEQGLVHVRRPGGTTVAERTGAHTAGSPKKNPRRDIADFLQRMKKKHGLTPKQVTAFIESLVIGAQPARSAVAVLECNLPQAADYARQIEASWHASAEPHVLGEIDHLPEGPVLATYFHFQEIRRRWPLRLKDIHFAAVQPDPTILYQLRAVAKNTKTQIVTLGETDASRAANILPDLERLFDAAPVRLKTAIAKTPAKLISARRRGPMLLSPRIWAQLDAEAKQKARAIQIRYVWSEGDLAAIAEELNWTPISGPRATAASA